TARDLERMTKTGHFVGTLAYVAPEQAAGGGSGVGPWSDVWSLGAVLFHALAGEPPIAADTPVEVLAKLHDDSSVRDVRLAAPDAPEDLAAVVARCLEKDPARRYTSASDLAADLERFLTGQPTVASASSVHQQRRQRTRRLVGINLALLVV